MAAIWSSGSTLLQLLVAFSGILLALWLVSRSRERSPAVKAVAAALSIAAMWSLAVLSYDHGSGLTRAALSLSNLAWLWALYRLFSNDHKAKSIGLIRTVVIALAFVELGQIAILVLQARYGTGLAVDGLFVRSSITFHLLFSIGALVLVHNLYGGATQQARQALQWPAAALGVIWLYDLNYYTISYLSDGLPLFLADLRGLALLGAIGLFGYGMVRERGDLRFQPSRSFAFQSFSLLVIGVYLVVMVLVAQGLSYIGSEFARSMQIGFVVLASGLALAFLPSKRMRGWLRVTLSKHLFQHRYDYRAEWMRFTDTIGRAGPVAAPLHERIVQAVADITDSPSGLLLTPCEDGGLTLDARWQWAAIEVPCDAICVRGASFYEDSQFILDLDDLRKGHADGVPVEAFPDWLMRDEDAWALVPLLHFERLVGVVVLSRATVARRLDWEDFDLLRVVGSQLASYLAEKDSQDALGEAQRFDEFNRRIAFVMHDIKNLASQLSLLAGNAQKHADNPEFREDMIITLRNSTDKLQALLARLGRYGAHGGDARGQVDLAAMLRQVAAQYANKHDVIAVEREPCFVTANSEALEQALVHLVQNAIEASSESSPVFVDLRKEGQHATIEIVDSGEGMSLEFIRTRLFKPFHSSKMGGFGIGAFEARELIRSMGGRLDVDSREGMGTRFMIRFPLVETSSLIDVMQQQERKDGVA